MHSIWHTLFADRFMDKNEKRASRFVKLFPRKKDATHASFPQIYSNNKKGRESDLSDSKKIMKKHKQKSNNFCLCYYDKRKS